MARGKSPPDTHPVVGVAIMFCDKCGEEMCVERNGRNDQDHLQFTARCPQCKVSVFVPVMITPAKLVP